MEDFYKQKIVWKRVGSVIRFSYDDSGIYALDSTCFATGKYVKYLVCILNSNFGRYILRESPKTGTGDLIISVQAIQPLNIPIPNDTELLYIEKLMAELLRNKDEVQINLEKNINNFLYKKLNLSLKEIEFIELQ